MNKELSVGPFGSHRTDANSHDIEYANNLALSTYIFIYMCV